MYMVANFTSWDLSRIAFAIVRTPYVQLIMPRVISNIILSTMDDCRESLLKISSFERELWKRLMAIKLSIMKNCKLEDDRSKRVFLSIC